MSLPAGTKLGPYEIVAPLGAGGMGEVYWARDTRLGRDVAVKVLPDDVSSDPRALARFESEARAVAALSHPNILALFDVGEANGVRYAVTELLEGESLRAVLARGPLPVRRALEVAEQGASALAAAHQKGIVHRDVKPENVFLTTDGRAKLLDFGLATRRVPTLGDGGDTRSPTVPVLSENGAVVGTVAYMSPEQARGVSVDFRTDQFALGIVLYEMLAGARPFTGGSAAQTLAAIIEKEPEPLETLAPGVPPPLRWIVERCLAKDPAERYDSTRDLARELATWKLHSSGAGIEAATSGPTVRPVRSRWLPMAIAIGLAGVLASVALLSGRRPAQRSRTERFEIMLPEGYRLFTRSPRFLDISPDGKTVVYAAFTWKKPWVTPDAPKLFLHSLDRFESSPIPGVERGFAPLFFPTDASSSSSARAEARGG